MTKAWHLKSRPQGMPTLDNFELKEAELRLWKTARSTSATSGCLSTRTCAGG